jgi:hypothetical protein
VTADLDPARAEHPHAHRRPGLVALVYGYRALASLVIALPAAVAFGAPTAGWPRGQGQLFDTGGVMLIESLRLSRRAWAPVTWSAGAVATVALLAGVLPLGALLAGLDRRGRLSATFLAGRAWAYAGTLALVFGLGVLAQGAVVWILMELGGKLVGAFKLAPPASDVAYVALVAVAVGFALVLGVLRDLVSVAAVRGELRFYQAASRGLRCARKAGGRALLAWAWRGLLGLAGLLAGAALASFLPTAPVLAIVAGGALHQAAIAGTTFAHASWLAAAMRLFDATAPAAAGGAEPSGEAEATTTPAEAKTDEPKTDGEPTAV